MAFAVKSKNFRRTTPRRLTPARWVYPRAFSFDPNAALGIAAVIAAGGSLTGAQQIACNTFVLGLKTANLWSKFIGLYLFVGSTSGAHSVNWKSPGIHNITWVNSPTHDSGGVKGNGTTSYGTTGSLYTSTHGTTGGLTTYLREAVTTDTVALLGTANVGSIDNFVMDHYASIPTKRGAFGKATFARQDTTLTSGCFTVVRRSSTDLELYLNGVSIDTDTTATTVAINMSYPYFLGARNSAGSAGMLCSKYISLQAIHASMTSGQVLSFYNLVQALQIAFSRNV